MKKIRFYFRYYSLPALAGLSLMLAVFLHAFPSSPVHEAFVKILGLQEQVQESREKIAQIKQEILQENEKQKKQNPKVKSDPKNTTNSINKLAKSLHHEGNPFEIIERKEGPKGFELSLISSTENVEELLQWIRLSQEPWSQEPRLNLESFEAYAPEQKGTAGKWIFQFTYPEL